MLKIINNVKSLIKELLTLNLCAVHRVCAPKLKILFKDIKNFGRKYYNIIFFFKEIANPVENIGNLKKITAKLLPPKSSAVTQ